MHIEGICRRKGVAQPNSDTVLAASGECGYPGHGKTAGQFEGVSRYVADELPTDLQIRSQPCTTCPDQLAISLDYVPLPDNAVKAIEASWKGIQGSGM